MTQSKKSVLKRLGSLAMILGIGLFLQFAPVAQAKSGGGGWDFEGKTEPQARAMVLQAIQVTLVDGHCLADDLAELIEPVADEARTLLASDALLSEEESACLARALALLETGR